MRLAIAAGRDQLVILPAGPDREPILDGLKHDVSDGGSSPAVRLAPLCEAELRERIVEPDTCSARGLEVEPICQNGMLDVGEQSVPVDKKTIGIYRHENSLHGFVPNAHLEGWRPTVALAGHIVVPPLPVKAGWRDRQVLSGCEFIHNVVNDSVNSRGRDATTNRRGGTKNQIFVRKQQDIVEVLAALLQQAKERGWPLLCGKRRGWGNGNGQAIQLRDGSAYRAGGFAVGKVSESAVVSQPAKFRVLCKSSSRPTD